MSDLGNAASNDAIGMTTSVFRGVANMIGNIIKALMSRKDSELAELEKQAMRDRHEQYEHGKRTGELQGMGGNVGEDLMAEMRRHGIETTYIDTVSMDSGKFAGFTHQCHANGVAFSAIKDISTGDYRLHCRANDLESMRDIIDGMNVQARLDEVEKAKQAVENDLSLTPGQKEVSLTALDQQGDELRRKRFEQFNDRQTEQGMMNLYENASIAGIMPLNRVLNNNTKAFDGMNDKPYYIVDAVDSDKYIECSPAKYTDVKGESKVGTTYRVYDLSRNRNAPVYTADDINKTGVDPKTWAASQWADTRSEIVKKSGMSDCVYKLDSKEKLGHYLNSVTLTYTQEAECKIREISERQVSVKKEMYEISTKEQTPDNMKRAHELKKDARKYDSQKAFLHNSIAEKDCRKAASNKEHIMENVQSKNEKRLGKNLTQSKASFAIEQRKGQKTAEKTGKGHESMKSKAEPIKSTGDAR